MHVIAYRRSVLTVFCTFVPGVPISLDLCRTQGFWNPHVSAFSRRTLPRTKCEVEVLVADRQFSRPCWKLLWTLSTAQERHLVQRGRLLVGTRHMYRMHGSALSTFSHDGPKKYEYLSVYPPALDS
jgi:hypothetical protein